MHVQALEVLNGLLFGDREPGAGDRVLADGTLVVPPDGCGLGLQVRCAILHVAVHRRWQLGAFAERRSHVPDAPRIVP